MKLSRIYLFLAIAFTALTIAYYAWMIPAWIRAYGNSSISKEQEQLASSNNHPKPRPLTKVSTYIYQNGTMVDIPDECEAKFLESVGQGAKKCRNYLVNGKYYSIPYDREQEFLKIAPNAEVVTRMLLTNGVYRSFTKTELSKIPRTDYDSEKIWPMPQRAYFIIRPKYRCDSALKINTSKNANYVVKIVNASNGEVILMCFLPAGVSQEIEIPSGDFEIRYTCGNTWYGEKVLFGSSGSYSKADRVFDFREGLGYEVTLYSVSHGNLKTSRIRKEDF